MSRGPLCAVAIAALVLIAASLLPHAALAQAATASGSAKARATIKDVKGKPVGEATLTQMAHGVLVHVDLNGLPPGPHGFHIHAVGKCEPPGFTSAGGHFNPANHKHGYNAAAGPHAGDLPNLIAGPDGKATVEVWVSDVSLGEDRVASGTTTPGSSATGGARDASPGSNSLFSQTGTSVVVHAKADDYTSDPAGNSGDRIACGVIER